MHIGPDPPHDAANNQCATTAVATLLELDTKSQFFLPHAGKDGVRAFK